MPYNTGNPIPSSDAKDLSDNAENLDNSVNTALDTWTDRLGVVRRTIQGQLKLLGYTSPDIYAGGLVFTIADNMATIERNKIIYAPLPSAIPFTTSGTWTADDENKFFVVQGLTTENLNEALEESDVVVLAADTVADMKAKDLQSGQFIRTKVNNTTSNAGGALYLIQTAAEFGGAPDGYGDHALANGDVAVIQTGNVIDVKTFGAKGDGVNDDQAAINAAISYLNPYVFQSTAGEIRDFPANRRGGTVNFPKGSYRITETIFGAPFVKLVGETAIGFSSAPQSTGEDAQTVAIILTDFGSSIDRFAIDTAPWVIATQVRDNGIGSWTGAEIDAGVVSSVRGFEVHGLTLGKLNDADPNVFGGIRFGASQNHYCTRVHVEPNQFKVGIMRFAAWGGAVNDCYLRATHIGMATVETTSSVAFNNYVSVRQDVQDFTGFPAWYTDDDDSVWDKDRGVGVLAHNSTVDIGGTIIEGSYRGIVAKAKSVVTGNYVYAEAVAGTVTDCIGLQNATTGLKECSFINIGTLDADNTANVFSAFFGEINCNQLTGDMAGSVAPAPTFAVNVSSTSKIKFYGGIQRPAAGGDFRYLPNQTFFSNVSFMEISDRSLNTFYVSPTGDDTKMGLDASTSLATVDEAIKRAVSANKDADILIEGDASYTVNMFDFATYAIKKRVRFIKNGGTNNPSIRPTNSGANTNGFIFGDGAVIEFDDVDLLHILADGGLQAGFDSMIECAGSVCIRAKGCFWDGLNGSNRPFFGTKYKQMSKLSVQLNECSLTNMKMSSDSDSGNGRMIVDLITLNTTLNTVTGWSSQVQVLHSDII